MLNKKIIKKHLQLVKELASKRIKSTQKKQTLLKYDYLLQILAEVTASYLEKGL